MAKNYRVALLLNANMAYDRGIITGISSFVKNGAPWSLFIGEQNLFSVDDFSKWQGDGVIADFDHPEIRDAIKSRNIPVVGIASSETVANTMQDYPVVMSDNKQIIEVQSGSRPFQPGQDRRQYKKLSPLNIHFDQRYTR